MNTLVRRSATLTIAAALTLSACGSSDSSDDKPSAGSKTSDSPQPTDGNVVEGSAYSYSVPKGWTVPNSSPPGFNFDSFAADAGDKDGFADNINVLLDPTVVDVSADKLEDAVKKVLAQVRATDVEIEDPVEVDGEEGIHARAIFEQNGVKYRTEQFAFDHDGKGYVVTISFSQDVPEDERDEVADSILSTWKWAS